MSKTLEKRGVLVPLREEIEQEVKQGRRVTLEDVLDSLEDYKTYDTYEQALSTARGIILGARNRLAMQGIPMVRLPDGSYGIPKTKGEVAHSLQRYAGYMQSLLAHTLLLKQWAQNNRLLPDTFKEESIRIPAFTKE